MIVTHRLVYQCSDLLFCVCAVAYKTIKITDTENMMQNWIPPLRHYKYVRMGEARHSRLNTGYFQRLNVTVNPTLCAKVSAKTVS